MFVEIIYTVSGRGLAKDAELLKGTIGDMGHTVSVRALRPQHPIIRDLSGRWSRAKKRLPQNGLTDFLDALQRAIRRILSAKFKNTDLVIHLENIHPHYINQKCANWLIPNQEWFRPERILYLRDIDLVLCKTHAAIECFQPYHLNIRYLGFSTPVAMRAASEFRREKAPFRILHVAGASQFKGTKVVLDAWRRNPDWPMLTLVSDSLAPESNIPANIELRSNLSEEELKALWQETNISVIPSEVEGYGQVLIEAMGFGTVVITTDAPPMNELVNADRGYLVPYFETLPFQLSMRYKVSVVDLEAAVNQAIGDCNESNSQKAANALEWTAANHTTFVSRLASFLDL